jgi:hypothetical protein
LVPAPVWEEGDGADGLEEELEEEEAEEDGDEVEVEKGRRRAFFPYCQGGYRERGE